VDEIRLARAQETDGPPNPCPSKKDRRWRPSELDEACSCPLAGSTDGGSQAGDTRLRLDGLEEMVAQERVGKHPEEAAIVPAKITDVAAERLDEEGLAQSSDDRSVAELSKRHLLAQGLEGRLE